MQYVEIELDPHETVLTEPGSPLMMEDDIEMKTIFGGEGLIIASLLGPGKTWIQSLPISLLSDRILSHARGYLGKSKGVW